MEHPFDKTLVASLGGRTAQALERAFGMRTVGDLLAHYPRRYAHRGELTPFSQLRPEEQVTIVAEVISVSERTMQARRGSILQVKIGDGRETLTLIFFNQSWRRNQLVSGVRGIFSGKIGVYRGARQLAHPDYLLFDADDHASEDQVKLWAETPVPFYPATANFPSWKIQKALEVILDVLPQIPDPLPESVRATRGLLSFRDALVRAHRPENDTDWRMAQKTLRFQEALVLQLALLGQRAKRRSASTPKRVPGVLLADFDLALPFALTKDQQNTGAQIEQELGSAVPMNRLVQGEVASGKTLVALRAMLTVAESGGQSAFLAPTEVLAAQHLRSMQELLGPELSTKLRLTLLTGQLSTAERRVALLGAASGGARIVVGTHALLSDRVSFADLALVVVDEQHRFGVEQRETLRLKGYAPHVLALSATPIPRTVAMTVFGDLDVSTLRTLPAGRIPIVSHLVPLAEKPGWEARVWKRMAEELAQGRQAFVVCSAIESGKTVSARKKDEQATVLELVEKLREHPQLAEYRIEGLHGKMPSERKETIMRAFASGDIAALVATTVIEVGVDVPNASIMVVLDADRFGVAQLHQLRGRVGRGGTESVALFVTRAESGTLARDRVEAVVATLDGFALAEADLRLRREGDILGGAQAGRRSSLKLLRVTEDGKVIEQARILAEEILASDPELSAHVPLRDMILRRFDESERAFLGKN